MVAPVAAAFPWGAAASFAGSLLGAGASRSAQKNAAQAANDDRHFAHELAKLGIQWRVRDAQAAGVHPLYALGAALPSSPGSFQVGGGDYGEGAHYAQMGQDIGRIMESALDPEARKAKELQLKLLESQIGESDARASYYSSLAGRGRQPGAAAPLPAFFPSTSGSAPYREVGEPGIYQLEPGANLELPGASDVVKVKPSEQTSVQSGVPYIEAAVNAGSKRYRLTSNMEVLLPAANDLGEALEPLSESMALMYTWYRINVNHYGKHFTDLAFQELGLPNSLLRVLRGFEGWSEFMDSKPGVTATQRAWVEEQNKRGRMISPERR